MNTMDEPDVIARCRAGDLNAYRQVYERYGQPLLRTATRLLGSPQEAEDAVQETFLKLFRGIGGFRSGSPFSTYLFQILNNTCIDALRQRKSRATDLEDMAALGAPSSNELAHSLAEAVDGLPRRMRSCFVLNAVERYSQEEVADMLGVSVGTVKTSVHRARRKLRAWLSAVPGGGTS